MNIFRLDLKSILTNIDLTFIERMHLYTDEYTVIYKEKMA